MVAGKFDSRIISDQVGAEKLLGQGEMLFLSAQNPFPVRVLGAFISDREVEALVAEVKSCGEPDYIDDEIFIEEEGVSLSDRRVFRNERSEFPAASSAFDVGLGEADPLLGKINISLIRARKRKGCSLRRWAADSQCAA